MSSLRLSVMRGTDQDMAFLRLVLTEFEARHHVTVDLIVLEWQTAWPQILNYATYGDSPDISLVGTTWITPLSGMQVLRPFSDAEARPYSDGVCLASAWNAGTIARRNWALPWQVDTRVIYYWRSALKRAGIEEATAFSTFEAVEDTVRTLTANGQRAIVTPTVASTDTLHSIAGWIWSAGGDFLSLDGKRVLFDEPQALAAIQRYYQLHRSLAGTTLVSLNESQADRAFVDGDAAIIISGPWIIDGVTEYRPTALDDLGIAAIPGTPYNGGSSFVIWRRSLQELAALDLIHFLMSRDIQKRMSRLFGQLPVRMDILTEVESNENRFFRVLSSNALKGRALPTGRLWGIVEERLVQTLGTIWKDVLDPSQPAELNDVVSTPLIRLAAQLNATLGYSA